MLPPRIWLANLKSLVNQKRVMRLNPIAWRDQTMDMDHVNTYIAKLLPPGANHFVATMSVILQEINSSVAKLRALLSEAKADLQRIQNLQNSLGDALHGLWDAPDIEQLVGSEKYWREFTSLITSGKIISAAAQADEALASGTLVNSKNWTGDGHEYARWLGRGIANVAASRKVSMKPLADLLGKSFSLGYTGSGSQFILVVHVLIAYR